MPTIEIISVGAHSLGNFDDLSYFAIRKSQNIVSDRDLFASDLLGLDGLIVHLGLTQEKEEPLWFCGHAIDWEVSGGVFFRFDPKVFHEISAIVKEMQQASPVNTALFLTDIQMGGGANADRRKLRSLHEFAELNSSAKLRWNTLYKIES